MIDVSSGGNAADQKIVLGPGYQVPFAAAIRRDAGIPTAAVGLITEPVQAEHILATVHADAVCLARALLRDPYWPRHAAKALGVAMPWPDQYKRCDIGPFCRCQGNNLIQCVGGAPQATECSANGMVCGYAGDATGYACISSTTAFVVYGKVTYEDRPPESDGALGAIQQLPV